jgi:hypothetical protein
MIKILVSFSLAAMRVAVVISVGIGINDDSIPLRKSPSNPYLVKKSVTEDGSTRSEYNIMINN